MSCALSHEPPNFYAASIAAQRPFGIHGLNAKGENMLHVSARHDDPERIKLALARGLNPVGRRAYHSQCHLVIGHCQSKDGMTPLDYAAANGSLRAMRALFEVPEVRSNCGMNARLGKLEIEYAAFYGQTEAVQMLLDKFGLDAFGGLHDKHAYESVYGAVVDDLVFSPSANIGLLKQLKALGSQLQAAQAHMKCPIPYPGETYRWLGNHTVHGHHCDDIAAENLTFRANWICECEAWFDKKREEKC